MKPFDFTNKTVIITGASSGIGKSLAQILITKYNAKVLAVARNQEKLNAVKAEFNNLFNNSILINSENVRVDRMEPSKELVYAGYNLVNEDENYYSVNAQIPILNINTDILVKICNALKCDVADIMEYIPEENVEPEVAVDGTSK
jgi:NAD(P)-dependent dehydrogenase (short-subunit alcohol dehydrogenase family)